ncbi:MAG: hypothetical protein EOP33_06950 [Rickettsiaceae bacterium]|nr:MAG: hypothetical protein EOP33_06950 [Rickettsiaceae bacterium]
MSKNYKPFHFVSPYSYWGDGEVQNAQPQSFFGSMAVSILACGNNCLMPKCILARPFCLQNVQQNAAIALRAIAQRAHGKP